MVRSLQTDTRTRDRLRSPVPLDDRSPDGPLTDIPENSHAVVTQDRIRGDALHSGFCYIIRVDVANKGVSGIEGQLLLESGVIRPAHLRIIGLACQGQVLVHPGVGVTGVVGALVRAEDLVGVVVRVEGAAPADEARHLSAPVHLGGQLHSAVDPRLPQLLSRRLGDVDAVLFPGHDADDKTDLLPAALIEAVCAHSAARRLQNLPRFDGVVVVMFYVFIVEVVSLKGAVGRHALAQEHGIDDRLAVNGIADRGDDIPVLRPVVVPEVEQDAPVIGGGHIITGESIPCGEVPRVFGVQQGQIQLAGFQLDGLSVVIGHDFEDDPVNLGAAAVVVLVFDQHDGLSGVPALQFIGTRAHRRAEEVGGLHVLALQQVLRQDGDGHVFLERHIRLGEPEYNRMRVDDRNLLHVLVVGRCRGRYIWRARS